MNGPAVVFLIEKHAKLVEAIKAVDSLAQNARAALEIHQAKIVTLDADRADVAAALDILAPGWSL